MQVCQVVKLDPDAMTFSGNYALLGLICMLCNFTVSVCIQPFCRHEGCRKKLGSAQTPSSHCLLRTVLHLRLQSLCLCACAYWRPTEVLLLPSCAPWQTACH